MGRERIIFATEKVMITEQVEKAKVKYFYIRDEEEPRRVLTIGYYMSLLDYSKESGVVDYCYSINKIVDPKLYTLDPRLRMVMGRREFQVLAKTFRRKFGGDAFSRKVARSFSKTRQTIDSIQYDGSKKLLHAIAEAILENAVDSDYTDYSLKKICLQICKKFSDAEQK
jgi:hypothetical protein